MNLKENPIFKATVPLIVTMALSEGCALLIGNNVPSNSSNTVESGFKNKNTFDLLITDRGIHAWYTSDEYEEWISSNLADGKRFLYISENRENSSKGIIYLGYLDGSKQVLLTHEEEFVAYPIASPDMTKIVFGQSENSGYKLQIMDMDGANNRVLIPNFLVDNYEFNGGPFAWSADNKKIAFVGKPITAQTTRFINGLYQVDVDNPNQIEQLISRQGDFQAISFSPDQKFLVFREYLQDEDRLVIGVINLTSRQEQRLGIEEAHCYQYFISQDSQTLGIVCRPKGAEDLIYYLFNIIDNIVQTGHKALEQQFFSNFK